MRKMRSTMCFVACCALLPAMAVAAEPLKYPPAPREPVVDEYFGTRVADPYRWLEDVDSAQTRSWVAAENALSLPYLARLPEREAVRARIAALWNYERYDLPQKKAGKLFYGRNDGLQNQSVVFATTDPNRPGRVLLDPNALSKDGTVALRETAISDDGRLFAYVYPPAQFVEPKVTMSRLAASLAPFPDGDAARDALTAAGGDNVREWRR